MLLDVNQTFQKAVALHRAGRLSEAEGHYRNILAIDPKHIDSLHLLGVIAHQSGNNEVAIELIGMAIAANNRVADFHNNMAEAHRALGRMDKAVTHYMRALKIKPDYADALSNLGLALMEQGKLPEATARFARALSLRPDHPQAHNNLGNVLLEQGKLAEAAIRYQQALSLKPDLAEAYNNLGVVRMWQGKLSEALPLYKRAVALKPDYGAAYTSLTMALIGEGDIPGALAAVRRALEIRETREAQTLFVRCVKDLQPKQDDSGLRDLVLRALSEAWDRLIDLANVSVALVKLNPAIAESVERASKAWPGRLPAKELWGSSGLAAICQDRLLRCLLESIPVCDIALERLLTAARSAMLETAAGNTAASAIEEPVLGLYCALARQCFTNEYVFACDDEELARAQELRDRLAAALESKGDVPVLWPITVAAYFPLSSLPAAESLLERTWPAAVTALLEQQVSEPREEQQIRADIPCLTEIRNEVSLRVQGHYEENPHPHWVTAPSAIKPTSVDRYLRKRFRWASFREFGKTSEVDVLIAGCGTGLHAIETAQQFAGARVLAVDLSLTSLGYAMRKTTHLDLKNVEYAQADILELSSIGRTFDVIKANGVLHHLADPLQGWRTLLSLLRPSGFMHLGIYSELARADITAARAFIAERGYGQSAADVRACRQELVKIFGDDTAMKNVSGNADFFSTGTCRDLLFDVQERRMTLPQIKAFLKENNLELLGFDVDWRTAEKCRKRFSIEGALTDLDLWHTFETENPKAFEGMYQFWIQKR